MLCRELVLVISSERAFASDLPGALSSRAAIVNGLSMMLLLPYFGLIAMTPKAVLAAIVVASVIKEVWYCFSA